MAKLKHGRVYLKARELYMAYKERPKITNTQSLTHHLYIVTYTYTHNHPDTIILAQSLTYAHTVTHTQSPTRNHSHAHIQTLTQAHRNTHTCTKTHTDRLSQFPLKGL